MPPIPSDHLTVTIVCGDLTTSVTVSHPERLDFLAAAVTRALQEHLLKTGRSIDELKVTLR